jgi:hypothetical protein
MLLSHARTLTEARCHLAALADKARTAEASSAYERALIELDRIHRDHVPALDTTSLTDDRHALAAAATSRVEQLTTFGVDRLQVELLLASLADAQALDEP